MKTIIKFIVINFLLISCVEKMPTQKDGRFTYRALNIDTLGIFAFDSSLGYAPFKNRKITIESPKLF